MDLITLDDPARYFERLAAFEENHWWSATLWRVAAHWLDSTLHGWTGLEALDIGCGAGLTLRRLAERPELRLVVGVDPCPEALAHATRWGHRVVEGSALALPFESGTFDVATCLDVVQHLPPGELATAAKEMARVLRGGGIAIVRSNCGTGGFTPADKDTTKPSPLAGERWVGGEAPSQGGREESRGITLRNLVATFAGAGFTIRHASPVNMFGSLMQELRPAPAREA